jgi:hypothetical protein
LILLSGVSEWVVIPPSAAPSTEAFVGNSPLGLPHGCGKLAKGQEVPFANPNKSFGAQDSSGGRVGFLLVTFLCPNKEK